MIKNYNSEIGFVMLISTIKSALIQLIFIF